MSYQDEEERLRMIQAETERKKRELQMLQEEELRHIRELERIKQQSGAYGQEYDPEMDSAFASVQQPRQSVQVPPQGQYIQNPMPNQGQYIQNPMPNQGQYVQQPVQQQPAQQQPTQPQPPRPAQRPAQRAPQEQRPVQQQQRSAQLQQRPSQRPPQNPQRNLNDNMGRNNYNSFNDDDDDDGADFDVAAYRAAERAKKQQASGGKRRPEESGKRRQQESRRREEDYEERKPKKKKKRKSGFGRFMRFIFVLLLILIVILGFFINAILSKFDHIDTVVADRDTSMKGSQYNILFIGQDAREGESGQRSDTMILCTINKSNHTVVLTSFMRDMYVDIPGYGGNRINAAYAFGASDGIEGSVNLLDKTIEEDFGVTIDGNMLVDLGTFLDALISVGNVDMELTAEEAEYMNENPAIGSNTDESDEVWDLHEGMNSLTPTQAMCYARMRHVGNSDWERTERQRKLIKAVISKVKHGNILAGIKIANGVAPCITTDLSKGEIMKMGLGIVFGGDMQSYRLPVEGAYYNDNINGMAVLVPDMEANKNYLQEYISGDYSDEE